MKQKSWYQEEGWTTTMALHYGHVQEDEQMLQQMLVRRIKSTLKKLDG